MPRYIVATRRAVRGSAMTALAAVENEPDVEIINGNDPQLVTIDVPDELAASLAGRLAETHIVEPEVRRELQSE